jgi:hypothetical protein
MKAQSILETIGNSPHIRMARMFLGTPELALLW